MTRSGRRSVPIGTFHPVGRPAPAGSWSRRGRAEEGVMAAESQCVLDPDRPCRACSASDPAHCPYLYLLGWSVEAERPATPDDLPGRGNGETAAGR
jgi:hypothetical protein